MFTTAFLQAYGFWTITIAAVLVMWCLLPLVRAEADREPRTPLPQSLPVTFLSKRTR